MNFRSLSLVITSTILLSSCGNNLPVKNLSNENMAFSTKGYNSTNNAILAYNAILAEKQAKLEAKLVELAAKLAEATAKTSAKKFAKTAKNEQIEEVKGGTALAIIGVKQTKESELLTATNTRDNSLSESQAIYDNEEIIKVKAAYYAAKEAAQAAYDAAGGGFTSVAWAAYNAAYDAAGGDAAYAAWDALEIAAGGHASSIALNNKKARDEAARKTYRDTVDSINEKYKLDITEIKTDSKTTISDIKDTYKDNVALINSGVTSPCGTVSIGTTTGNTVSANTGSIDTTNNTVSNDITRPINTSPCINLGVTTNNTINTVNSLIR